MTAAYREYRVQVPMNIVKAIDSLALQTGEPHHIVISGLIVAGLTKLSLDLKAEQEALAQKKVAEA